MGLHLTLDDIGGDEMFAMLIVEEEQNHFGSEKSKVQP